MLRKSDCSWAEDEKRLQCRKGDQKSDERVLDRLSALPILLQAADVLEGQRLTTTDGVQTIAPDDWQFVWYRSSDAEAVTHITALRFPLCVSIWPQPSSSRSDKSLCAESHFYSGMGA
jgi:hypothetical protein